MAEQDDTQPYVPASKIMPELTIQAVVLGILLSLIMCAANIYVGLKAGMTVSAAIPASVISMGILRGLLKRGTILENNIVHTIASSGESLAAGIIFTVPALVMAGIWTDFHYWETTLIAMSGGVMGVTMMIPLRRAMIVENKELKYPEGVACAEVLKAGDRGGAHMKGIFIALLLGAGFKVLIDVVGAVKGTVEGAFRAGKSGFYFGTDVSPMLMAVGFIVGWEISLLVFLGGAISYLVAMPILSASPVYVNFDGSTVDALWDLWDTKIRFFGIGAMVVAGIASIIKVGGSIRDGLKTAIAGMRGHEDQTNVERTEQGITGRTLVLLTLLCVVLSGIVYWMMTRNVAVTIGTTALMFVLAFFFVAVASYIVGLVGSSNSPVSGMAICTVLITAGLFLLFGYTGQAGVLATLGVAGVVCCAACTSGDICQDLKIGQLIGATPRRLQTGEIIGTILPAFIIAPVMNILLKGYGIGANPAREGVQALAAPQGAMFEKLTRGLFGNGEIPWNLVWWGAAVGVLCIAIDTIFLAPRNAKFRLYAMPLAVGMYLPWTVTFPILFGGLAYLLVVRKSSARGDDEATGKAVVHEGLLAASGLVAGEAIMGILIAVLLASNVDFSPIKNALGLGGGYPDSVLAIVVSLVALGGTIWFLMHRALAAKKPTGG